MSDSTDMSTPVTRDEFAQFQMWLEQQLAQLATKAELAQLATKTELAQLATKTELWGGALLARIDRSEQRLLAELARHTRASAEEMSTQISAIDDKYTDLPSRVSRLELKVLTPKQR